MREQQRYYSFNRYLREQFGERVHRISLDAGFNCPNIDGRLSNQGCSFCDNSGFCFHARSKKSLEEQIRQSIDFYTRRLGVKKFIAYFQAFSNTYADLPTLKQRYDVITKFDQIVGLFIATRPDCVDRQNLSLIAGYKERYMVWIEYGLASTHNPLLEAVNRNHTYEDFLTSLELTRSFGINAGVHMILGLPQASRADMMIDIRRIARLDLQGVKFHVLHILKGSPLEASHQRGEVCLLEREAYIKLICDCLEQIPREFVVLRLVSSAPKERLLGPLWMHDKDGVLRQINAELAVRGTYQGVGYETADYANS